jgi:hypothetical protein
LRLAAGSARITSRITRAQFDFNFAVLHDGGHNLRAGICQVDKSFEHFIEEIRRSSPRSEFTECSHRFDQYFGEDSYSLKSLFCDERRRIVGQLVDSTLTDIDQLFGDVSEHNTALIGFLRELGMPLPPILRVSCEFALSNAMQRCFREKEEDLGRAHILLNTARQNGIAIDASIKSALRERLNSLMQHWAEDPLKLDSLTKLVLLASLMREPIFDADLWKAQNIFYEQMMAISVLNSAELSADWFNYFAALATSLGITVPESFPPSRISNRDTAASEGQFPAIRAEQAAAAIDLNS